MSLAGLFFFLTAVYASFSSQPTKTELTEEEEDDLRDLLKIEEKKKYSV